MCKGYVCKIEVLTAITKRVFTFRVVRDCRILECYQRLEEAYRFHLEDRSCEELSLREELSIV
jgi:hypothetical protein